MVASCIAFNFVENGYLRKAFSALGMSAMSRKEVSGKRLQQLSQQGQSNMRAQIASMDFPAGASDGWRKKCCESGAGLMNFTVMGNQGVLTLHSEQSTFIVQQMNVLVHPHAILL
jgi:hypothetical protein